MKKNAFSKTTLTSISFANPKLHEAYQFSKILSKSLDPNVQGRWSYCTSMPNREYEKELEVMSGL
jgi:hypothetical protein